MTIAVDVFRVLASVASTLMILSPIPSIYQMHRTKSTGVSSLVPLVSMFFNCHVTMLYGILDHNIFPVVTTFLTGDVFSLLYIAVFYYYCDDKSFAHKTFLGFGIITLLTTAYAVLGGYGVTSQSRSDVTLIVGYICIIATVVLYTSPFEKVGLVLKHRSAVFIPIHMVVAGTLNNGMWLVYASLTGDWIILAPNAFCFAVGCVQIVLYFVFNPRTHPLDLDTMEDLEAATAPLPQLKAEKQSLGNASSPCFVPLQSPPQPQPPRTL